MSKSPRELYSRPTHTPWRHRFWRCFYDRIAFAYDAVLRLGSRLNLSSEARIRRQYIAKLHLPSSARILEVGAGTAANLPHLPAHTRYTALDQSRNMLKRGQSKADQNAASVDILQSDAQSLPLAAGQFDLALCMGTFQHLESLPAAAAELLRVSRPGARVLVIDEIPRSYRSSPHDLLHARLLADLGLPPHLDASLEVIGEYYLLDFEKNNPLQTAPCKSVSAPCY